MMWLHYIDPRFIRRSLNKRRLWEPLLIFIILFQLFNDYKSEIKISSVFKLFGSSDRKHISQVNNECMPIDIEVDSFEKLVKLAKKNNHPNCNSEDWVKLHSDGKLTYNLEYTRKNNLKIDKCWATAIRWGQNDFKFSEEKANRIWDGDYLSREDEFFKISCVCLSPRKWYHGFHARIFQKKELIKDPVRYVERAASRAKPINVMFLGLDSVSREKWLNGLPMSSDYLIKKMGSLVLRGYNIVGDGTPAALIPILTGRHEEELPNTLKGVKHAVHCDKAYPFVWKNFTERMNYATMYNEDWPKVGVFQYRMIGFSEPPTTHYPRPFQLAKSDKNICEYGRTSIQVNLDYIEDFMHKYNDLGFFSFSHIKQYTHNEGLNDITWLDSTFLQFLKNFHEDKAISQDTILFMFSDHGPRYSKFRKSIKGLLHERNPFFSIYVPPLFKERYPNEYASLQDNTNKVLAPMDIHATLLNLIDLETGTVKPKSSEKAFNKKRGISLFGDISPERTCEDAGIDSYWCSCLKRTEIKVNEYLLTLADVFVDYVNNNLLKEHTDLCNELEVDTVNSVYLMNSYLNTTERRTVVPKNKHEKTLRLLQPPKIETDYRKYLFVVTTKPNHGEYEFTITVQNAVAGKGVKYELDKSMISRINKYGNDEHCIHDKYPDLRKYCYCKDLREK